MLRSSRPSLGPGARGRLPQEGSGSSQLPGELHLPAQRRTGDQGVLPQQQGNEPTPAPLERQRHHHAREDQSVFLELLTGERSPWPSPVQGRPSAFAVRKGEIGFC